MRCELPEEVIVRSLTPRDLPLLRSLNLLFAVAFHDAETYCSDPPSDEYVTALLADPCIIALVALVDTEVAGGLVAYELHKFEHEQCEIYLYDLAVGEPFRRRGVASVLLEQLFRMAVERGASSVFVQADYVDEPAIALYSKFGVRKQVLHFDINSHRGP